MPYGIKITMKAREYLIDKPRGFTSDIEAMSLTDDFEVLSEWFEYGHKNCDKVSVMSVSGNFYKPIPFPAEIVPEVEVFVPDVVVKELPVELTKLEKKISKLSDRDKIAYKAKLSDRGKKIVSLSGRDKIANKAKLSDRKKKRKKA